jgi:DNA-binding transcriptional LysR family regulator
VRLRSPRGPWARLPGAWTASRRRRRLLLLAAFTPGVLVAVFGAEACQSLVLLGLGLAWILIIAITRWLGEPRPAAAGARSAPLPSPLERSQ